MLHSPDAEPLDEVKLAYKFMRRFCSPGHRTGNEGPAKGKGGIESLRKMILDTASRGVCFLSRKSGIGGWAQRGNVKGV